MSIAALPESAPFVLEGHIERSRLPSFIEAIHCLNDSSFAGFPADFLFFDSLVVQPSNQDGCCVRVMAGICESIQQVDIETGICKQSLPGTKVWGRAGFDKAFTGLSVLQAEMA